MQRNAPLRDDPRIRRWRAAATVLFVLVGVALLGCASGGDAVTVYDGSVRQSVFGPRSYVDLRPSRFVFVLDVEHEDSAEAALTRAYAEHAVREMVESMRTWSWGRSTSVGARATILIARSYDVVDARDDPRLLWNEERISRGGAEQFADGIVAALSRRSVGPPSVDNEAVLYLAATTVRPQSTEDITYVLVTDRPAPRLDDSRLFRGGLSPYAQARYAVISPVDAAPDCPTVFDPRRPPIAEPWTCPSIGWTSDLDNRWLLSTEPTAPTCRVRAFMPTPSDCWSPLDGLNGWSRHPSLSDSPEHPRDARYGCEVMRLEGDDRRRCEDGRDGCEGCASGYCVVSS